MPWVPWRICLCWYIHMELSNRDLESRSSPSDVWRLRTIGCCFLLRSASWQLWDWRSAVPVMLFRILPDFDPRTLGGSNAFSPTKSGRGLSSAAALGGFHLTLGLMSQLQNFQLLVFDSITFSNYIDDLWRRSSWSIHTCFTKSLYPTLTCKFKWRW